jgi:predicted enzyme related to lactoylglutathione lyase
MSTTRAGTQITGMDLAAYFISDPARSIAFYRDVLGIAPTDETPGRGGEFTLADGQTFGVWKPDEGEKNSGGAIMFAVGDAKAAVERFRANGADIQDVLETPACFMAPGVDPDGNVFIIHQRKTAD